MDQVVHHNHLLVYLYLAHHGNRGCIACTVLLISAAYGISTAAVVALVASYLLVIELIQDQSILNVGKWLWLIL